MKKQLTLIQQEFDTLEAERDRQYIQGLFAEGNTRLAELKSQQTAYQQIQLQKIAEIKSNIESIKIRITISMVHTMGRKKLNIRSCTENTTIRHIRSNKQPRTTNILETRILGHDKKRPTNNR